MLRTRHAGPLALHTITRISLEIYMYVLEVDQNEGHEIIVGQLIFMMKLYAFRFNCTATVPR